MTGAAAPGSVVVDLCALGATGPGTRTMATYARHFARALEQVRPELVASYLLPPGLSPPPQLARALADKLATKGEPGSVPESARVFHSLSVSDLSEPTSETWPAEVEEMGLRFSATVHEVIPLALPSPVLERTMRRRCRARCEVLRQADAVLAVSEAQRRELVRFARVEDEAITVVGSGAPWGEVAERAAEVFDALATHPRHPGRATRVQVAVVTPLLPIRSGVADYSTRLLEAFVPALDSVAPDALLDCFADGRDITPAEPALPAGVLSWFDARRFLRMDKVRGGYDAVLYVVGNSEFHTGALTALRARPGTVLAHEVGVGGMLGFAAWRDDAVPGGLEGALRRALGTAGFEALQLTAPIKAADLERLGLLLVQEIAEPSRRVLVSSEAARALAVAAAPELADRFAVLPFAMARRGSELAVVKKARGGISARPLVASFGIVDDHKLPRLLVEAVAAVRTEPVPDLTFVGPVSDALAAELSALATTLGIAGRLRITGHVEQSVYLEHLGRASIAVQLRAGFAGESSAAVADCLAVGVPTIVSDLGWLHELPDDTVAKVDSSADDAAAGLAATIESLLQEPERRAAMAARATEYAAERSYERAAAELVALLGIGHRAEQTA